jgi:glycosyltransferase involved in cell wall biosynthesis
VKPVIIYFGTDWAGANRTSSHHVARWLAERYRMVYFECPGLRAPGASGGDAKRLWDKLRSILAPPRRPAEGVTVRTLLQLPLHGSALVRWVNARLLGFQVRRALRAERIAQGVPRITWFSVPHVGMLAGTLNERLSIYYCVDDYAAFPGVAADGLRAMDAQLTRAADLVFVTSDTLLDDKRRIARAVHHAPHGVDVSHFAAAAGPRREAPSDLPTGRPIIGYFGLVAEWIDLDLVDALAGRHPEWQFVLIGRIAVPTGDLPVRDNILFLGGKPYEQLPDYGAWFDVAIIPYRLTQQVLHANPIKLREYIAMQKPIVAVDTPNIRQLVPLVEIATDLDAWDAALSCALAHPVPHPGAAAQQHAAAEMSWTTRLGAVERTVLAALESRPGAA